MKKLTIGRILFVMICCALGWALSGVIVAQEPVENKSPITAPPRYQVIVTLDATPYGEIISEHDRAEAAAKAVKAAYTDSVIFTLEGVTVSRQVFPPPIVQTLK